MSHSIALSAIFPGFGRKTADRWRRWPALWRQWRQRVRDRQSLTLLGEHERGRLAADIGVSRADFTAALSRPPWRDRRVR
jgi:uncharacterized protein YjiS (DUF1127 family)